MTSSTTRQTGSPLLPKVAGILGGLMLLGAIVSATTGETTSASVPAPAATSSAPSTEAPAPEPTEAETTEAAPEPEETTEAPAPEPEPAEPEMTVSQENAVESAESYLDYAGFSKKGLIDQLKFEDYSTKDATFAVNHVDVNWNTEAEQSAESYMDYSSFSRSGLIDQLKFEGFTTKQATHGAESVGL